MCFYGNKMLISISFSQWQLSFKSCINVSEWYTDFNILNLIYSLGGKKIMHHSCCMPQL